ncbi:MAG: Ig-like domain-containing protein, partial [Mycobacterium sp.]|nr:Ig-like domain-containing protein [Mycobacterium sp.]
MNKAAPAIPWVAPAAIAYGTALSAAQLDAGSTVAGTFVYTPTAGVVLGVGTQTLSVTFTPTDSGDYSTTTSTVQLTVNKAAPVISWTAPAAIAYGTALSAAQLNASSTVAGTFVYTPGAGVVLTAGSQTLSVTFTPTDSSDYSAATATVQLTVNTIPQTINFISLSPLTYGSAPITLAATGGASGNPIIFSIISGPGSIAGSTLTINGTGSVVVAANQTGNASYAAATQVTQSIVVNPALTAIAVASSASTVLTQNAVTLTATVSSPAGIPTGTVSFLDGTTPLGPGTLSGGVATLTTSLLAVGTHSISAVYSGGTNFVAATSAALTQCVMDFSLSVSGLSAGGTSQTVTAGGSANYSLAIAPSSGTSFPVAVTLTVSGLPATATASVIPAAWALSSNNPWTWTLPANTPLTSNSQLTIQMSQSLAQTQPNGAAGGNLASRLAPFSLALLILP